MHSSILKIKTATNTWIFVTDIVNICLYNTQCNKYTFYHQIYSLLFRNVLQIRMKDMLVENMKPESFWGVHVVSYCEYLWEQSDILPFDLRGELEAALRRLLNCPTPYKLGLKSWKTYFHILKSAFSYFEVSIFLFNILADSIRNIFLTFNIHRRHELLNAATDELTCRNIPNPAKWLVFPFYLVLGRTIPHICHRHHRHVCVKIFCQV